MTDDNRLIDEIIVDGIDDADRADVWRESL